MRGSSSSDLPLKNPSPDALSGTAATGAAIKGFVYAKDVKGNEINVATELNGSFKLTATSLTPPILLKIVSDNSSTVYYSYAQTNNQTVNVTPLTDLALFLATGKKDLQAIYTAWNGSGLTHASLQSAQATINANLAPLFAANALDSKSYNFLTQTFSANSTGIDKVLDDIVVLVDGKNGNFNFNVPTSPGFVFDETISVAGINISGSTSGGTMGAGETAATIREELAKQYSLTFSQSKPGSGIANGTLRTFALGSDGSMVIDGVTTLTNPVLYLGNAHEAIWTDDANNLKYAFSSLVEGKTFNEINVSNNVHYDQAGFIFYGQFRDGSVANNNSSCIKDNSLALLGGSNVTDLTGTKFCPTMTTLIAANAGLIQFIDAVKAQSPERKGGVITLQRSGGNSLFSNDKIFLQIKYEQGGVVYEKYHQSATLAEFGIEINQEKKVVTFTNVVLSAKKCTSCTGVGSVTFNGLLTYN